VHVDRRTLDYGLPTSMSASAGMPGFA
jgi:hypothetical protein